MERDEEISFGRFQFRPFAAELTHAAGEYDGEKVTVRSDAVQLAMVQHHEAMHERLTRTTADGALVAICMRAVEPDSKLPVCFQKSAGAMHEHCLLPHEAAATYLSIKMYNPASQAELIERLPPEYRDYYNTLADVIDGRLASSSYSQFLIGISAVTVALSSPLLKHVVTADWSQAFEIAHSWKPDVRLRRVLRELEAMDQREIRTLMQACAERACAAAGVPAWDIDDEAAWQANLTNSRFIEPDVIRTLIERMAGTAKLDMVRGRTHWQVFKALGERLGECGVEITVMNETTTDDAGVEQEHAADAMQQAVSVVRNAAPRLIPSVGDSLMAEEQFLSPRLRLGLWCESADTDESRWGVAVFGCDGNGDPKGLLAEFSVTQRAVIAWLTERENRERSGQSVAQIISFVIGVRTPDVLMGMTRLLQGALVPKTTDAAAESRAVDLRAVSWPKWVAQLSCWYIHGDLLAWLLHLGNLSRLRIGASPIVDRGLPEVPQTGFPLEAGGVGTVVIRLGEVEEAAAPEQIELPPGVLVRIYNRRALSAVDTLLDKIGERGAFDRFGDEDWAATQKMFTLASEVIVLYWSEY